jgi:TRAP-type C4-dicarboxylate transport system permease small subunit
MVKLILTLARVPLTCISYGLGLLLLIQVLVIVAQVLARNLFSYPLTWSEELARYLTIWVTFVGGGVAVASDEHVFVDIVMRMLPRRWHGAVMLFADLATGAFLVLLIAYSVKMFSFPTIWYQYSPAIRVPMVYLYASLPVGATIMLVLLIARCVVRMQTGSNSLTSAAQGGSLEPVREP